MFHITKDFPFEAAHKLIGLPEGHPCTYLHGHSYRVRVELSSETLESPGFVQDYRELEDIKDFINNTLDHRYLNDIFPFETTAENMAKYIYDTFKEKHPLITSVAISETAKTWAKYRPTLTISE